MHDPPITLCNEIVIARFKHGQQKDGVQVGGDYLCPIITPHIESPNITIFDPIHISTDDEKWKDDYNDLYNLLSTKKQYILLGGDHSIGNSSVAASIKKVDKIENLYVLWIDAHSDTNTIEMSLTKNYHGTPLASLRGYEKPWFPIKSTLVLSNLLYFGIRDMDLYELQKNKEDNIYSTSILDEIKYKLKTIIDKNPDACFHISFDVDSLDPSYIDSTGVLAERGLKPDDIIGVINYIKNKTIALDIVEFNPLIGNVDKSKKVIEDIIFKICL